MVHLAFTIARSDCTLLYTTWGGGTNESMVDRSSPNHCLPGVGQWWDMPLVVDLKTMVVAGRTVAEGVSVEVEAGGGVSAARKRVRSVAMLAGH